MNIPKNVLKRKIRENNHYFDMYVTVGELKNQLNSLPDDAEIEADYGYYEGDLTSYYVSYKTEETLSEYRHRIKTYAKRKKKEYNYKMVSNHIINYVKNNSEATIDEILEPYKGKKYGFRCSAVFMKLMVDGYIGFNEDGTKILFLRDLPSP